MKGVKGLAGGVLILAIVCAAPAVSLAQDSGVPPDTTTTTADPPPAPIPEPTTQPNSGPDETGQAGNSDKSGGGGGTDQVSTEQPSDAGSAVTVTQRSAGKAHASASARVTIDDFFFSPATVTVSVGDIVTWHNSGKQPHTATADDGSFDTGTVVSGQSASHMFTKNGTFTYYCTIHPNMKGTVKVLAAGGGSSGGKSGAGGVAAAGTSPTSGPSEAAAVASPNAAGSKNSLAATGMPAGALALAGLALLAAGLLVRSLMAAEILVVVAVFSGVNLGVSPVLRQRFSRPA
ncbi:MAG: cupredoxin family copper-binding protein [Solirubrobacterales bacterium]